MSFTVVPLHEVRLPKGTTIQFGNGLVFQDVPEWLKQDEIMLNDLGRTERILATSAHHAFVAEYEAGLIGTPDPNWKGKNPKSIQKLKFQSALMANLSIWLVQPSRVSCATAFHAISALNPDDQSRLPRVLQVERETSLFCHPRDNQNLVDIDHVGRAGEIHQILSTVPRKNPLWEALRAVWAGLTMRPPDHRYQFFWMALEALFGPNDSGETTYKLCQRLGFFLADQSNSSRNIYRSAKTCYNMRSKIVHGRWKDDPKIDDVMAETEDLIRMALNRLVEDPKSLELFQSSGRDEFLEDMVFS